MTEAVAQTAAKMAGAKMYPNRGLGYSKFDSATQQQWDGYCDCCTACDDFCNCCKAAWCPCATMQDNALIVGLYSETHPDNGGCSKYIGCWTACAYVCFWMCLPMPAVFAGAFGEGNEAVGGAVGGALALCGRLLFCWPNMWFRSMMGKQFNLPVCDGMGCFVDCCCELCCWPLVYVQEGKTSRRLMTPEVAGMVGQAIGAAAGLVKAVL